MSGFNMGASKSVCKMYVIDPVLREEYEKRVAAHNTRLNDSSHPDSGFDILQPSERILYRENELNNKIPLGVMAAAYDIESGKPLAYYLFPHSSISRSNMRMSNSVGIIDSGYRGELIAAVDLVACSRADGACSRADVEKGNIKEVVHIHVKDRYFQICMGDLRPFYVELVDTLGDLGITL